MVFSSLIFLFIFLPIFLLVYKLTPTVAYKNMVLFIFSIIFYAWGEPSYIFLILFLIAFNYILARQIEADEKAGKANLIFSLVVNVGVLFIFKYLNFLISNLNFIFGLELSSVNLKLPIGISFFTFQIISYLIDVYRKEVKAQKNILNLGAYIIAFPQLIAGPIVRYSTIEKQLEGRTESLKNFTSGSRRFIIGLSKKVLIANAMAEVVETILRYEAFEYKAIGSILMIVCYTFQIYFDFSGYSDMAIGLGRMLGFHYLENFNYPYAASSITEFWRRWHISLGSFFKDYVYIPLGGNRVSKRRWILNIFIVWGFTGLWHGASWNFVLWGFYYALLLVIEKISKGIFEISSFLKHIITLMLVMFGWALFRLEDLAQLKEFVYSLLGSYGLGSIEVIAHMVIISMRNLFSLICAFLFSMPIIEWGMKKAGNRVGAVIALDFSLLLLLALSTVYLLVGSFNPFIYFRF